MLTEPTKELARSSGLAWGMDPCGMGGDLAGERHRRGGRDNRIFSRDLFYGWQLLTKNSSWQGNLTIYTCTCTHVVLSILKNSWGTFNQQIMQPYHIFRARKITTLPVPLKAAEPAAGVAHEAVT